MKKLFTLLVLFSVFITAYTQSLGTWQSKGTNLSVTNRGMQGLSAVDSNTVWAITYELTGAINSNEFTRTIDGGASWTSDTIDLQGPSFFMADIFALNKDTAWIAGYTQDNGELYHTNDGGQTWTRHTGSFNEQGTFLGGVHFFNSLEGFAYGGSFTRFKAWTTSDGGATWIQVPESTLAFLASPAINDEFVGFHYGIGHYDVVGDTIWVGSTSQRMWRSSDRGKTWSVFDVTNRRGSPVRSVAFKNAQSGIAVTDRGGFQTNDGGRTWSPLALPQTPRTYYQIEHIPGTNGVYYLTYEGSTQFYNDIKHAYSIDNGKNWVLVTDPGVECLEFVSPTKAWGGGAFTNPTQGGMYQWTGNIPVLATPDYAAAGAAEKLSLYTTTSSKQQKPIKWKHILSNTGKLPLTNVNLDFKVTKDGNTEQFQQTINSIASGATAEFELDYLPLEIGKYNFSVVASNAQLGAVYKSPVGNFEVNDSIIAKDDGVGESQLGFGFGNPNWYGYYGSAFDLNALDTLTAITVYISSISDFAGSIHLTVNAFDATGRPNVELFHSERIALTDYGINANNLKLTYQLKQPLLLPAGKYVFAAGQDTVQGRVAFSFDLSNASEDGFWLVSPIAGGGYPWAHSVRREALMIRPHFNPDSTTFAAQGKWEQLPNFPGVNSERAFHFTIGDKMYVGTGRSLNWFFNGLLNETDVWTYEFETKTWTQLKDFPGGGLRNARSFVIDGKAYIVTAFANDNKATNIFWKYDPATDTWEKLPDFPGQPRSFGVAFAINGKGYVGLGGTPTFSRTDGFNNPLYYNDLYEYNPATDEWKQLSNFPGSERWRSFSFVIDGKAYVGGGDASSAAKDEFTDTYSYDPATDTWTRVADFPSKWSFGGFSFALDGKGYANEGGRSIEYVYQQQNNLYEYDPQTNQWTYASTIIGPQWGRLYSFATTYEGKAYIGGGSNYSVALPVGHDDFYVWDKNGESSFPEKDGWEELGTRNLHEEQKVIYSIATAGEDTIWAAPAGLDFDRLSPLELTVSTDGGLNWQTVTVDEEEAYNEAMVYAVSGKEVFVFASKGIYEQTALFSTNDGGKTWAEILSPSENNLQLARGLHFFDALTGLCFGYSFVDDGYLTEVYRTTDGGATWALDSRLSGVSDSKSVDNLSGNNGYDAVGNTIWLPIGDTLYRSTDRGASWNAVASFSEYVYSIAFENEMEGMVVVNNAFTGEMKSGAFRTIDGGLTWQEVAIPTKPVVSSIEYVPGTNGGFLAYSSYYQYSSDLLYTPNAGADWYTITAPTPVITAHFTSASRGFIGTSIHPTLGGDLFSWVGNFPTATSTKEPSDITNHIKLYPNPFTNQTLLEFDLKDNTLPLEISVRDLLGRNIKSFNFNKPNTGINQIPLSIDAPAGVFLLLLRQGNHVQTLKMIKH
jgi:photosystem II stability/assembly factor-like uncharacterized protein/N-acetylneuraminic acid mutarotase